MILLLWNISVRGKEDAEVRLGVVMRGKGARQKTEPGQLPQVANINCLNNLLLKYLPYNNNYKILL